jgi:Beta-galactosidase/beta-glucuronidase
MIRLLKHPALLAFFLTFAVMLRAADNSPRQTLSLDGQWSFQLDPDSVGDSEGWHLPEKKLPHSINVPGAWDAQGFGPETEKMRNNFIGKGWYQRTIDVPSASADQRFFLRFGGVYRDVRVWVNGHLAGYHLGYVSAFEFDITPHVQPGQAAVITLRVNSEQQIDVDPLMGCLDIPDHLFSFWGGVWGHISLERRNAAWLDELFVQPRLAGEMAIVSARLRGDAAGADAVRLEVFSPDGRKATERELPLAQLLDDGLIEVDASLPGAPRWSPETPNLHRAQLTLLRQGRPVDRVESKFGMRSIEIRGHDFYVNGKKYYLNGYGDDAVYVETIAAPSEKQFYIDRLKVAKSYGFNFVRHHSHFVSPEYYEACDEVGMFVSPELPIAYPRYYARSKGKPQDLYRQEWTGAILRYRNHPSIFNWCMGNELWEGPDIAPELYAIAKKLDPSRHVIDSDGIFASGFVDGSKDRPTMDYYTAMFDILTMPLDNPEKFKTGVPLKPIVTHEEGNFVHFPRLDSIELYEKTPFKPFWLTIARDKIAAQGLLAETPNWSLQSEKLYYLCHKYNLEALRKNPRISGYHWWLLQPWYPGSNGLLDVHRRPISITPEQVRQINAPVVLLQDGLGLNYRGDDRTQLQISVSNYSPEPFAPAQLSWRLTRASQTLREGSFSTPAVDQGAVAPLGTVDFVLPNPSAPEKLTVTVALKIGDRTYTNQWDTWVYPKNPATLAQKHPLYVSNDLLVALAAFNPKPIPATGQLPSPAVYVARQPTARLLEVAERGSSVVLLSPAGVFPTDVTTFKSAWWLGVFPGDNNAGTVVYDSPITKATAPDGWCDDGWFHLLQGSQTVILDDLPAQPDVLIRALNTHSAPTPFTRGLDFDYVWRNKSLLFETRVGQGSWIVSGLNFDSALRHGGPEGPWLLTQLLARAQSLPKPKNAIPLETLRAFVENSPFAQSSAVVEGFSRLVKHFGEKATGVTYRENKGEYLRIRQEEALHELTWETAPVPAAERTTFVFAGGFSFTDPIPNDLGFGLSVNGVKVINFDTTREPREWKSADGRYTLRYVPALNHPSWSETMGLLYLSVPADNLAAGQPARIRIHSIGHDNGHWFALNPYRDILSPAPLR